MLGCGLIHPGTLIETPNEKGRGLHMGRLNLCPTPSSSMVFSQTLWYHTWVIYLETIWTLPSAPEQAEPWGQRLIDRHPQEHPQLLTWTALDSMRHLMMSSKQLPLF